MEFLVTMTHLLYSFSYSF